MTYEYLCTACHHEWEADQRISAAPLEKCPKCKKQTARRQISGGSGFVLKGGGWYADLYGSPQPKASKSEDGDGNKAEEKKAEGKQADSKQSKEGSKSKSDKSSSKKKDSNSQPASGT